MNTFRRSTGMTALAAALFTLGLFLSAMPAVTPAAAQALTGLDTTGGTPAPAAPKTAASATPAAAVAPAASQAPAASGAFTGYVTAKIGLRVRKGPWGAQVGLLAYNTKVTVTATEGEWYIISYGGAKRYIHSSYVKRGAAEPPAANTGGAASSTWTGYVTAGTLNVRSAPWGTKVTTYSRGTAVKVTGKSGEWYKIDASGRTLYVHSTYISKDKPSSGGSNGGGTGTTVPSTNPGTNSGNVRNPQRAEFTTGTGNQRILSGMRSIIDKYLEYPAACGKRYDGSPATRGNLGCAFAVSMGLQRAGYSVYSLGVDDLSNQLMRKGFTKVSASQRRAGDVVVWNPSHIGIIAGSGRAISNSSSLSKVTEHTDRASSIRFILRPPA